MCERRRGLLAILSALMVVSFLWLPVLAAEPATAAAGDCASGKGDNPYATAYATPENPWDSEWNEGDLTRVALGEDRYYTFEAQVDVFLRAWAWEDGDASGAAAFIHIERRALNSDDGWYHYEGQPPFWWAVQGEDGSGQQDENGDGQEGGHRTFTGAWGFTTRLEGGYEYDIDVVAYAWAEGYGVDGDSSSDFRLDSWSFCDAGWENNRVACPSLDGASAADCQVPKPIGVGVPGVLLPIGPGPLENT